MNTMLYTLWNRLLRLAGRSPAQAPVSREEAALAGLALLAARPQACGTPCPDAGSLAALAEGKLHGAPRDALLEHLEGCPDCRGLWIALASGAHAPSAESAIHEAATFRPLRWLAMPAAAGAAGLAAFLLFWPQAGGEPDPAFQAFLTTASGRMVASRGAEPGPPYLRGLRDDAAAAALPERSRAFAAGQWSVSASPPEGGEGAPRAWLRAPDGRADLQAWASAGYADYFELGQWLALRRLGCEGRVHLSAGESQEALSALARILARVERRRPASDLDKAALGALSACVGAGPVDCISLNRCSEELEGKLFAK
ncbi:hypothetical protein NNJEOMEG_00072 [Fundidesulfovibrio magnetotacticus]|uniref:Putative zinc-finger domain-containing protein n=2 Tax=Fundidesulfovibrio magnetotacticus TaxID=2730080 RepID=A0A6V8LMN1_9BACT|nr:hypothetical protein NNJEOMEG_00072 [Fundidesulfovibrio magnetotacticus]